jgi:hypothetical protein
MTKARWSIYVDMQGFSELFDKENQILLSLSELMRAIYRVGTIAYPLVPDRLFAHQTGDGFVIVSDFHEPSPMRAIAIAIVLLRRVASTGRFARAAISEGELADIVGCYPREVTANRDQTGGVVILGEGLMTLFPIMGTALIRAFALEKREPPGPLLLLDGQFSNRLPTDLAVERIGNAADAPASIDWIHSKIPLVSQIWPQSGFPDISDKEIEEKLIRYQQLFKLCKWAESLRRFLKLPPETLFTN